MLLCISVDVLLALHVHRFRVSRKKAQACLTSGIVECLESVNECMTRPGCSRMRQEKMIVLSELHEGPSTAKRSQISVRASVCSQVFDYVHDGWKTVEH